MMVFQQVKVLFLSLVAIFRRALCCFSRRRKPSLSQPIDREGLQSINVIVNEAQYESARQDKQQYPERDWNSWDDSPRTIQEHIEQYRQRIAKPPTPQKEEPEPDFFTELEPVIKPQLKYYMGQDDQEKTDFSRLEAITDVPIAINPDLEDWEESQPDSGWDVLDSEQAKQLIREKRKELRNQRHQQKKSQGSESEQRLVATRLNNGWPQQQQQHQHQQHPAQTYHNYP